MGVAVDEHLAAIVVAVRNRLEGERITRDAIYEKAGPIWDLVHVDGLSPAKAAAAIHECLVAAGLSDEEIRGVGVSEASIRPIARNRHRP